MQIQCTFVTFAGILSLALSLALSSSKPLHQSIMSGYRTLHRISTPSPLYRVHFSSYSSSSGRPSPPSSSGSLRLLTTGPSNQIHIYSIRERTSSSSEELDATPLLVETVECLVPSDFVPPPSDGEKSEKETTICTLGYGAIDTLLINNVEIIAASQLGGRVGVWVRFLDPDADEKEVSTRYIQPLVEFDTVATGTTLAIQYPSPLSSSSSEENHVLLAMGCADGSILLLKSGIIVAKKNASTGIVGDSSTAAADSKQTVDDYKSTTSHGGELLSAMGKGHDCVLSLSWHPTIPNTIAVGRKDGSVDIYSSSSSSDEEEEVSFRRMHHISDSTHPIRALTFSRPNGMLLFAGDDGGILYQYDVSVGASNFMEESFDSYKAAACPVKLVACALTAHKGWIMNLTAFDDEKRVCSCSSDKSVKVWDCGMGLGSSMAVHSFEGVHGGWVWDVAVGSLDEKKKLLVSCGNDGVVQVFSCGD
jgi:WD40 repeat protein